MHSEINLHHITLLENHLVARIRCVMRSAVVEAQTAGETHATLDVVPFFQSLMTSQRADGILDPLRDFNQSLAGLDVLLRPLPDLAVRFSGLAILLKEVIVHAVEITLLLIGSPVRVLILVLANLSFRVLIVGEELGHRHAWRRCLLLLSSLLLLLRLALLLLFRG